MLNGSSHRHLVALRPVRCQRRARPSVVDRWSGPLRSAAAVHRGSGRRGDELLIVVPPQLEATVSGDGQPFVVSAEPPADELGALWERFATASGAGGRDSSAIASSSAASGPPRCCRPRSARVAEWRPQLVLHEAAEYASAIAAERCGVAHAQVAISLAEVEAASLDLAAPALARSRAAHRGTAARVPVPAPASPPRSIRRPTPRRSGFERRRAAAHLGSPTDWHGSDAPLVYVTFGSVAGGLPNAVAVYRTALDAVAGLRARVLLTVGPRVDLEAAGPVPENTRVERGCRRPTSSVRPRSSSPTAARARRSARWPPACRS